MLNKSQIKVELKVSVSYVTISPFAIQYYEIIKLRFGATQQEFFESK